MSLATLPKFHLMLDTREIEAAVDALTEGGAITALIYNDAQSKDGTYYFRLVDGGRGPVVPVHAKALHWVDKATGQDVFAMHAGPVAPRHIVIRAVAQLRQAKPQIDASGKTIRQALVEYVNQTAVLAVEEMVSISSEDTGELKNKYRIVPAIGEK